MEAFEGMSETTTPGLERVPGWEGYGWLRAGFSTRLGGVSEAYGEMEQNLGWTDHDAPEKVAANRNAFVRALGIDAALDLMTVQQVHGARVREMDVEQGPLMSPVGRAMLEGDGMITATAGRLLAILTADCVPVLIADTRSHAVGAFHAGWRGTLAGIVTQGVTAMRERYDSKPQDLIAAIGPCIQACCFEVGAEVREAFLQQSARAEELFAGSEASWHMDLAAENRRQLLGAGLLPDKIFNGTECTSCTQVEAGRRKYFSYRAEKGRTGRMLSGIAAVS